MDPKPKRAKRVQPVARLMWAQGGLNPHIVMLVPREGHPDFSPWTPVAVIDLSRYDEAVEVGAKALDVIDRANAALRAVLAYQEMLPRDLAITLKGLREELNDRLQAQTFLAALGIEDSKT